MRFILAALLLAITFRPASAAPTTPEAFTAALKSAIEAKSTDQLLALTYTAGMSEADKQRAASGDRKLFFTDSVTGISLGPLSADFPSVDIANGRKSVPTAPPKGFVVIDFTGVPGDDFDMARRGLVPYTIVGGGYYLLSYKSIDLGWKGPPDKTLSFLVTGGGQNGFAIAAKWNASGVEQERNFKTGNMGRSGQYSEAITGQYFEAVTVTSTDNAANVTLTLMENGKQIYVSPPLKGKGTIAYPNS